MANTNINKTYASSGTRTKWTWSFWLKRGTITNGDQVISTCHLDNSNQDVIRFGSADDKLDWWSYQSNSYSNGGRLQTNRVFRDCNAWYHIVLRWDSSNSTAGDRMKMWVNGVEETSFSTDTNPTTNRESLFNYGNNSQTWKIGSGNNTQYFDGSLSHIHFCDNYLYQASDFGSTDSTTGEWKINASPNVQYGTNGYTILKDGNTITDQSVNSNNWSAGTGTLTKTEDNPSNVFATLNPLYGNGSYTFANGNNSLECNNTNNWGITVPATLGATSGKYYWEARQVAGSHTDYNVFSFIQTDYNYTGSNLIASAYLNGIQTHSGGTCTLYVGTNNNNYAKSGGSNISISDNDIVSFALDIDNQKGWIAKNGVWIDDLSGNAGNPTTGANALFTSSTIPSGQMYSPCSIQYYDPKCQYNFGNGYFGTTAVSSNSGNGYSATGSLGIFQYQPPTGYTALSTKGLNL